MQLTSRIEAARTMVLKGLPGSAVLGVLFSGGKDSMACLHLLKDRLACAIYADTGFSFPETHEMVNYAASLVPMHVVLTDRKSQQEREGMPSDVVPVDWTALGQHLHGPKPITIQSYLQCRFENVSHPMWLKAKALGVTHLVTGARADESKNAGTKAVSPETEGIISLYPLHDWTEADVFAYLETVMTVPAHYYEVPNMSSLDCWDCTAFLSDSGPLLAWMKRRYPHIYAQRATRENQLYAALQEALALPGVSSAHEKQASKPYPITERVDALKSL